MQMGRSAQHPGGPGPGPADREKPGLTSGPLPRHPHTSAPGEDSGDHACPPGLSSGHASPLLGSLANKASAWPQPP